MRCNQSWPCTGWYFEDVSVFSATDFPAGDSFICEGIFNSTGIDVAPSVNRCFQPLQQKSLERYDVDDDLAVPHQDSNY